jgi:glycosyltransferase involved in cell wall biosynthesis
MPASVAHPCDSVAAEAAAFDLAAARGQPAAKTGGPGRLRILFLTHYYPPEVNAPANRVSELARQWQRAGHEVTIVTCAPNHPYGRVLPGYRNALFERDRKHGIDICRVWTWLAANEGFLGRTTNYVSFLASAGLQAGRLPKADIVVSTSPQFFCGLAGYLVSRIKRVPWVLEIRDLWPESIVAVGAMMSSPAIRVLERIERFAYRKADHIVVVTDSFVGHIVGRGGDAARISVIKNGVDLSLFGELPDAAAFRRRHGLEGKFVAAYIGTHGMAHQLETILEAAAITRDDESITYLMVGAGAERERLVGLRDAMRLANVVMLDQMPRAEMPTVWAASDASLVLLRPAKVFDAVIPSKIFEAMAMRCPIILGVGGEARQIIEAGRCGLPIAPGSPLELAAAVRRLAGDRAEARALGDAGRAFVAANFDRAVLADRYQAALRAVVQRARGATA